ncbi:MAG: hypothetical protein NVS4B3_25110 [Gemmatimonadaceae bacterium]
MTAAQATTSLADAWVDAWVREFPETGTLFGIPGSRHDRLNDNSAAAEQRWQRQEDAFLTRLRQIDAAPLVGRPEWITYGFLREELEASTGVRICHGRVWNVHPMSGVLANYSDFAELQPVGSEELRAQAVARWRNLPRVLDAEIANLREGVRTGYTEPKVNVRRVIDQADAILATAPTASPFFNPATRDTSAAFRKEFEAIVANDIHPAVRRYRDYLATEYLPAARDLVGVAAHPEGAACYRAAIRRATSVDATADEIHRLGIELVASAESTMRSIAVRRYETRDLHAVMTRARAEPSATFGTRAEVVPALYAILDRAQRAAPQQFGVLPKARVIIQPVAVFQEASTPLANYVSPAIDGSRPGIFHVNVGYAMNPGERLRMDGIAFHEGVPGHHFQLAIALERGGVHPITRYLQTTAFSEGWAIYAERVADEMGLFSTDGARLRWLEDKVYEAATLVMETGIHAKGWTRQQAIDYELAHTTRSVHQAEIDVDRRIGWLGQGLSYQVGALEILRLRRQAERELGPKFDVRLFHDRVLTNGSVTLPMLHEDIGRWISQQHGGR